MNPYVLFGWIFYEFFFLLLLFCLILWPTQRLGGLIVQALCWATAGTQSACRGGDASGAGAGGVVFGVSVTGHTLQGERAAVRHGALLLPTATVCLHLCHIFFLLHFSLASASSSTWLSGRGGVHKDGAKAESWLLYEFLIFSGFIWNYGSEIGNVIVALLVITYVVITVTNH